MFTREQLETALDAHNLYAHMGGGRYWRLRRNGRTQTWVHSPERFRIPVKAGLRSTGRITEANMNESVQGKPSWSIGDPNHKAHNARK
jgi:hypothetical protein